MTESASQKSPAPVTADVAPGDEVQVLSSQDLETLLTRVTFVSSTMLIVACLIGSLLLADYGQTIYLWLPVYAIWLAIGGSRLWKRALSLPLLFAYCYVRDAIHRSWNGSGDFDDRPITEILAWTLAIAICAWSLRCLLAIVLKAPPARRCSMGELLLSVVAFSVACGLWSPYVAGYLASFAPDPGQSLFSPGNRLGDEVAGDGSLAALMTILIVPMLFPRRWWRALVITLVMFYVVRGAIAWSVEGGWGPFSKDRLTSYLDATWYFPFHAIFVYAADAALRGFRIELATPLFPIELDAVTPEPPPRKWSTSEPEIDWPL